jgi:hypothetical protein
MRTEMHLTLDDDELKVLANAVAHAIVDNKILREAAIADAKGLRQAILDALADQAKEDEAPPKPKTKTKKKPAEEDDPVPTPPELDQDDDGDLKADLPLISRTIIGLVKSGLRDEVADTLKYSFGVEKAGDVAEEKYDELYLALKELEA